MICRLGEVNDVRGDANWLKLDGGLSRRSAGYSSSWRLVGVNGVLGWRTRPVDAWTAFAVFRADFLFLGAACSRPGDVPGLHGHMLTL